MRRVLVLLALAGLAGCGGHAQRLAPAHCRFDGAGVSAAPDRSCTPGEWIDADGGGVCRKGYNPRPPLSVTARIKRLALAEYGLKPSDARKVEADHLYPVWLGGATVLANEWPEPNYPASRQTRYTHNPKDALEFAVFKRTCQSHKLTVAQARAVFEGDWRTAYRRFVGPLK